MLKNEKINFKELILHQDDDYTIVNKPPNISCLEDRNTPLNLLALAKEINPDFQICHRLDKETSGVTVFANNNDAYKHFAIQLEDRVVKKVYHAVVSGRHSFEDFAANEPLYTTTNKSRVDFSLGKPSLTLVSTLEIFKKHTLVKCFPVSGRMHQIRAHLAYHECSLVQDINYGGKPIFLSSLKKNYKPKYEQEEKPLISRVALHASEVAFHDLKGDILNIKAVYPKDFSILLKQLKKFS